MKVVVARVADFPDGDRKILDVNGRSVGVFRIGNTFYAMRNQCPHHHGPLCVGFIMQRAVSDLPGQVEMADGVPLIACPWHGWEYDLETGQSVMDLLDEIVRERDAALVVITHDPAIAARGDRHFRLESGTLTPETYPAVLSYELVGSDSAGNDVEEAS